MSLELSILLRNGRIWTAKKRREQTQKKKKLSLDKPPSKKLALLPSSRFNTTVDDSKLERTSKGYVPVNTLKSTVWAVKTYTTWAKQRNHPQICLINPTLRVCCVTAYSALFLKQEQMVLDLFLLDAGCTGSENYDSLLDGTGIFTSGG